jgi:hypothetical protein
MEKYSEGGCTGCWTCGCTGWTGCWTDCCKSYTGGADTVGVCPVFKPPNRAAKGSSSAVAVSGVAAVAS